MLKSNVTRAASSRLKIGASTVAMLAVIGVGSAAIAQETMETVTVTGFRESLEKALDLKRTALDASDSIMAEDIGKFPDMNVSESLQRIPGVAISRESGEGRQITVRGLSPSFTRVRINGMETLTTVGGEDTNTSQGGGGTNRGRSFDFNVFASELFSALTVHKSNSASIEEGSLGATVDLKTAHPFDYSGFVFTSSAQYGYQEYGGGSSPRVAAMVSDTFMGGRLGVLFSGAYAIQNTLEEGSDNGRWVTDYNTGTVTNTGYAFYSVNGLTSGSDYQTANAAFRPRFPRYAIIPLHEKRLGLTGSIQWQPDDDTLFTVDGLFADFSQIREEMYMEPYALSASASTGTPKGQSANTYPRASGSYCIFSGPTEDCSVPTYTTIQLTGNYSRLINFTPSNIDSNANLYRGELTNVGLRSEHRIDHLDTRFMQVTINGSHTFSQSFKANVMAGWSESHHRNPIQTTLTADLGCITAGSTSSCPTGTGGAGTADNPFIYDYSSGKVPYINMGLTDPTDANGWYLSQIRERANGNFNAFRTVTADFDWTPVREIRISGGIDYRNYGYNTFDYRRSAGSNTNLDAIIPEPIQTAFIADPNAYAQVVSARFAGAPAGSTTTWWVPSINKMNAAFGIWDQSASHYPFTDAYAQGDCDANGATWSTTTPYTLLNETNDASLCGAFHMGLEPNITATGSVVESDYGGWIQFDWDTTFYGVPFRGNIGGRYVLTEQTASGYVLTSSSIGPDASHKTTVYSLTPTSAHQTYHDFLPALNAVFEPADNFIIRINASYAMARPNLSNLLPSATASVSGSNWNYTVGNPALPPSRSKNIDVAFEWYYHKGAMLSIAGFYKHLDNLTKSFNTPINWATGTGATSPATYGLTDPSPFAAACGMTLQEWTAGGTSSICGLGNATQWNFTTNVNDKGAPLYGMELNWQQPLDFLPGHFSYLGVLGNLTFVQAQQTYLTNYTTWNGSTIPQPAGPGVTISTQGSYTADLIGLSRTSYNATVYYDDSVFQTRLTAAFRSKFMLSSGSNTLNLGTFSASTLNVDASASWKYSESIMFTVDALNLTNQAMDVYVDAQNQRTNIYHQTGRVFFAGIKYTY